MGSNGDFHKRTLASFALGQRKLMQGITHIYKYNGRTNTNRKNTQTQKNRDDLERASLGKDYHKRTLVSFAEAKEN